MTSEEKKLTEKHNEILSIVSHDLKSPMVAIMGYAGLILKDMQSKPHDQIWAEMLGRIVNAGQGMQDLIEDILAMAKMEAGKEKVEPDWVEDLSSELLDVVKTFEYEAGARGIGMSLDITHPLPQVEWDIRRIRYHVLNNIISNSLKFTPSGGKIVLSARATEMGVEIRISDTGSGIPENERKRIFNKFEKAENPLYSLHSGSGLGLYNAHLFVTQHGGKIDVENSSDKGTTFLIVLPLSAGSGY